MVFFILSAKALLLLTVSAATFCAQVVNIPQDAIEVAKAQLRSPLLNEANFQSRIYAVFHELSSNPGPLFRIPIKENYSLNTELQEGQYQLEIVSQDFDIANPRVRVVVAGNEITAYDHKLANAGFNEASVASVSNATPFIIRVLGFLEYYETPQGKLLDMLNNSPLGFIFRSRAYTLLFVSILLVMVAPTVLCYFSPELAPEFNEARSQSATANEESSDQEKFDYIAEKRPTLVLNNKVKKRK